MAASLMEALEQVPDPRDPRGRRHPLAAVLGLAAVAVLAGCKSLEAVAQFGRDRGKALAHALGFRRAKTPAKSTLSEVFRAIDADALEAVLATWADGRRRAGWGEVAIDGKVLKGSADGEVPGAHLLAAFAPAAGAVLAQVRVGATTNEHKAALRLLGLLPPLRGAVVTADAMFTHRDFCEAVLAGGGDYLLPAADNQPTLRADLAAAFEGEGLSPPPEAQAAGRAAGGAVGR
jgi:hypothetical protein